MVEYLRIENILNYSYDDEINHKKIENFIKGLKICYQLQSFFFMDGSFDVYIYDISNNHPKLIHKESNFLVEGYFLKSNEGYFIYEYKNLKQRSILEDIVFLELLPEYYHLTFKELDEFNRININKALFTLPSFYYDYHSQKLKKIPRILPKYSEDDIYECGELEFTKIENYGYFFQIKFDNNRYRYVKFKIIFLENSNNIYKKSCYLKSELDDIIEMHNKNNLEIITQKKPLTDNIKDFFGLLPNHQPKEYIANQLLENKKDNIQISQHQTELKNKDQQITTLQQQLQEAQARIKELEQQPKQTTQPSQGDAFLTLGAVMDCIKEVAKSNYTQQNLIDIICKKHKELTNAGISVSTLSKQFPESKRYLMQHKTAIEKENN